MAIVRTPGGRIGNDRRTGSRRNGTNWVERTKPGNRGSLPRYIRIVRNGLMKEGHSESRATALAVAAVKRWARGGGNVSPAVRKAAAAAVAEWEAMKAKSRAKSQFDALEYKRQYDSDTISELGKAGKAFKNSNGEWSYPIKDVGDLKNAIQAFGRCKPEDKASLKKYIKRRARALGASNLIPDNWGSNTKGDEMQIEHKNVGVSGVKVGPEDDGIIEAFVSITGVRDNVGDIIEPGSYKETLEKRLPKGIWSHDWNQPVSKTLEAKELMPGDPMLPKTLPDGSPWPEGAGALWVKTQFNLEGPRGQQAYADVKFFGSDQEWSIGYNVPAGKATMSTKGAQKTRNIKGLDLYEYSPVLWGAMPHARSSSVKMAQQTNMMFKSLLGEDYTRNYDLEDLETFLTESKSFLDSMKTVEPEGIETKGGGIHVPGFNPDEDEDRIDDRIDYEDDEEDEGAKVLTLTDADIKLLQDAGDLINQILGGELKMMEDGDEEDDYEGKSLGDIYEGLELKSLEDDQFEDLEEKIDAFDTAIDELDLEAIEASATKILDFIGEEIEGKDDETVNDLKTLSAALSNILTKMSDESEDWADEDEEPADEYQTDDEDDEDYKEEEKVITLDLSQKTALESESKDIRQWLNSL